MEPWTKTCGPLVLWFHFEPYPGNFLVLMLKEPSAFDSAVLAAVQGRIGSDADLIPNIGSLWFDDIAEVLYTNTDDHICNGSSNRSGNHNTQRLKKSKQTNDNDASSNNKYANGKKKLLPCACRRFMCLRSGGCHFPGLVAPPVSGEPFGSQIL